MQENLLDYLACPNCGCEKIELQISKKEGQEISFGTLICCDCFSRFPIIGGIPSMLPRIYESEEKSETNLTLESSIYDIRKSEMLFRDTHATGYDNISRAQAQLEIDYVMDELNLSQGKKYTLLDLGCGTGRVLLSLIPYAQNLIGIDFSLESLRLLKSKLRNVENSGSVHLIHGDAAQPALKNKLFDAIVSVQLVQSFPDEETRLALLKQIHRVARPQASFVLSTFYYSLLKQLRARYIKNPEDDIYEREGLHLGHLYYHNYSSKELNDLFIKSGFKTLRKRGVNTPLTRRYGVVGAKIEKLLKWSGILTPFSHWITVSAFVETEDEM